MRRARVAVLALVLLGTGMAAAIPVPALTVSDGQRQYHLVLQDGATLAYSYRQSIYGVIVVEEFVRSGDLLELRRVVSDDIRSIEYFRWPTPISSDGRGYATKPPTTVVPELLIRITRSGEQRLRSGDREVELLERFGETIVRVTLGRPALLPSLIQGLTW
ncbi:MAG TPA: hypothetical protein VFM06_06270 [Candidatus Limnocylindria bacterium]|nr:hypothetical protein [Candidatus Limnocylindria bacterium]